MTDRIVVHVMSYGKARKYLQLRWIDPRTGRWSYCAARTRATSSSIGVIA